MSQYIQFPSTGGIPKYATFTDLPVTASDGTVAITLDTDTLYAYNASSMMWLALGGSTSVLAIGPINSVTSSANGAVINVNSLVMQSATSLVPGLIDNANQTLSGIKTFTSALFVPAGVDVAATGGTDILNIGTGNADVINIGRSGITINMIGSTVYENVTNLQVADKLIGLNIGGGAGTAFGAGIELEENSIITGYVKTSVDRNSWALLAPNTVGIATITPGAVGITLDQSSHNPVTLGTSNGLSLSTQVLSLQAASTTLTGALTSTDWNTFNSKQAAGNYLTALIGDGTAAGPGSAALTLATVNGNVGSFGTASQVGTVTVNAKGLITAASNTSIQISESQVTNLVSDLAGKQPTGNYITALTGDATASGPGSSAITFSTVNASPGAFGSASQSLSATVNGKGLITALSAQSIQVAESQVTNLVSDLASKVATSSLGNLTDIGTDGISITGGTGAVIGSVSIAQQVADATHNGYLSNADWSTFNAKQTAGSYITSLNGDVAASGPGAAASTIQSGVVSNAKLATMTANTVKANITGSPASPTDVPLVSTSSVNSAVFRDSSGNFAAGTITATLSGNATTATNATTAVNFSGSLGGEVSGGQSSTVLSTTAVISKGLTGFVSGAGTVTSADSILSGIQKVDGNTILKAPIASPTFTGVVTIPTPFTLGATSVTSTGTQLNYLSGATGTTGTGNVVLSGSPTITTSATAPLLIGGTTASSTLTLESTSGAGTTDSIVFKTGSQATRATIDTSGAFLLGTIAGISGSPGAGELGLANSNAIKWKNAGGTAFINAISVDSLNNLQLGGGGAVNDIVFSVNGINPVLTLKNTTGLALFNNNVTVSGVYSSPGTSNNSVTTPQANVSTSNSMMHFRGAAAITVSNLATGVDGQRFTIINGTGNIMSFLYNDTTAGGTIILNSTGTTVTLLNNGSLDFVFSSHNGNAWYILGK